MYLAFICNGITKHQAVNRSWKNFMTLGLWGSGLSPIRIYDPGLFVFLLIFLWCSFDLLSDYFNSFSEFLPPLKWTKCSSSCLLPLLLCQDIFYFVSHFQSRDKISYHVCARRWRRIRDLQKNKNKKGIIKHQSLLMNRASKCIWDVHLGKVKLTVLALLGLGHGLPVPGPLNDKITTMSSGFWRVICCLVSCSCRY